MLLPSHRIGVSESGVLRMHPHPADATALKPGESEKKAAKSGNPTNDVLRVCRQVPGSRLDFGGL